MFVNLSGISKLSDKGINIITTLANTTGIQPTRCLGKLSSINYRYSKVDSTCKIIRKQYNKLTKADKALVRISAG